MKKFIIGIIMAMVTCIAFAIPSPQQIENALAGGNPAYARNAIQQVLAAKPNSGKAHILNAYLLAHYDLNNAAANAELQRAVTLDPSLTKTPLFGRIVDELDTHKVIRSTGPVATIRATPTVPTTYVRTASDHTAALIVLWGCLIFGGVMLIVLTYIFFANRRELE